MQNVDIYVGGNREYCSVYERDRFLLKAPLPLAIHYCYEAAFKKDITPFMGVASQDKELLDILQEPFMYYFDAAKPFRRYMFYTPAFKAYLGKSFDVMGDMQICWAASDYESARRIYQSNYDSTISPFYKESRYAAILFLWPEMCKPYGAYLFWSYDKANAQPVVPGTDLHRFLESGFAMAAVQYYDMLTRFLRRKKLRNFLNVNLPEL